MAAAEPRRLRGSIRRMRSRGLERGLLFLGVLLLAAVVAEMVLLTVAFRSQGLALWRAVAVEVVAGREAAIPIAISGGVPRWMIAQVSATQDIGVVCLAYPLFLRLMHRFRDRQTWLMTRLRRIQKDADEHRGLVRRWGGFGVFLFMLVPFLVNGPLVGAIAGRLTGMTTKDLMLPVVAATCIAALAWTYFYDVVLRLAGDLHPLLPVALTALVIGLVVGSLVLRETLQLRRERQARKK
ncbi:MAG TPA: small multi-drug export protein [Candidatus Thermoplasmatota archaeon]|nr:small multi-drug export protein [Candidatus Thermoplasmatota archaeon]